MLISTKGRYALRVLVDMAEHQADGYVTLKEIAERQEISEKYLESLVKPLVQEGIVTGLRGKGGGYRLASSPENVSVSQVLSINACAGGLSRSRLAALRPGSELPDAAGLEGTVPGHSGVLVRILHRRSDGGGGRLQLRHLTAKTAFFAFE